MAQLVELLAKLRPSVKIVMVYLAEAHAADTWPLGFDINQPKNISERAQNCKNLLDRFPALKDSIDAVFLDSMDNEFNKITGAWPEKYFFANDEGIATWKSPTEPKGTEPFDLALRYAMENGIIN